MGAAHPGRSAQRAFLSLLTSSFRVLCAGRRVLQDILPVSVNTQTRGKDDASR